MARDDFMWLRVLDAVAVLGGRRSLADRRVVIEVLDEAGFAGGRYELDGEGCRRSRRTADLTVPVEALGAVALGGPAVRALAAAGWLREEGAAGRARRHGRAPPLAGRPLVRNLVLERAGGARQLDAVGGRGGGGWWRWSSARSSSSLEAVVVGAALVVVADPPAVVVVVATTL